MSGLDRARRPPRLVVVVELEERPRVEIVADSLADELRLSRWAAHPRTARAITAAVRDALEAEARRLGRAA